MELFEKAAAAAPEATKRLVRHSFDIADRIYALLQEQGKSQKDLAKLLGKRESEISKWLTGQHNFTIKTIATIEAALGEDLLVIPSESGPARQNSYSIGEHPAISIAADGGTDYKTTSASPKARKNKAKGNDFQK